MVIFKKTDYNIVSRCKISRGWRPVTYEIHWSHFLILRAFLKTLAFCYVSSVCYYFSSPHSAISRTIEPPFMQGLNGLITTVDKVLVPQHSRSPQFFLWRIDYVGSNILIVPGPPFDL